MSALESVSKLVNEWNPQPLPSELKYRDSLIAHLRERLKDVKTIEPEFRHLGTTTDIYVKQAGFWGESEVFVELKRDLKSKAQLDRLVGQIESLNPQKNTILVVLCDETKPALLDRLREKYKVPKEGYVVYRVTWLYVIVKEPTIKTVDHPHSAGNLTLKRAPKSETPLPEQLAPWEQAVEAMMVKIRILINRERAKHPGKNIFPTIKPTPNEDPDVFNEAMRRIRREG